MFWTVGTTPPSRSGGWRRGSRASAVVDQVLQLLAGLEERNLLGRNFDPVAGLRIAPNARLALAGAEAAKSADLNLVTDAQRTHYAVKDRLHNHFAVFAGKFRQPGNLFDQVRFCNMPICSPSPNRNGWL